MKKRSLFAAVAMLIVSAIVLTSATYAWFQSGRSASMTAFSASISNGGGAITISADNTEFKTELAQADYYVNGDISGALKTACAGSRFPSTLTPVSFDISADSAPGVAGTISGTTFTASAVPNSGAYVVYTIYVKADSACTVNVTANYTQTTAPFIWAAIKGTTNTIIVNPTQQNSAARSYTALDNESTGTATDSNANAVVDSTEANSTITMGGTYTAGTNVGTLVFSEAGTQSITVYEWAEGQDLDCKGAVSGSGSIGVSFEVQQGSGT